MEIDDPQAATRSFLSTGIRKPELPKTARPRHDIACIGPSHEALLKHGKLLVRKVVGTKPLESRELYERRFQWKTIRKLRILATCVILRTTARGWQPQMCCVQPETLRHGHSSW
jgi:hypothetical protein